MENFKTFGECSNNIFKQLLTNHADNINKRHTAKILDYLEANNISDNIIGYVKKELTFYGNDIKYVLLALGGNGDGK